MKTFIIVIFQTKKTKTTDITAPDVGGEYLVLLVEVEDLDESDTVADVDRLGCVEYWTTDDPNMLVVVEQVLYQLLLRRHRRVLCARHRLFRLIFSQLH